MKLNFFIITIGLIFGLETLALNGNELSAQNNLSIGTEIPEISLPSPESKKFQLSSLKGKYVLIDFWASWCIMCKSSSKELKSIYNQFKNTDFASGKGFAIYDISLDGLKKRNGGEKQANALREWKSAIQSESRNWIHVSDLNGWNSPVVKKIGVKQLPFNVLISPEGIIMGKNLTSKELEKFLTLARTNDSQALIKELKIN